MDRISLRSSGYFSDCDVSPDTSSVSDSVIDEEIAAYDQKQIYLARNDRRSQIQHANSQRLTQPVNYPHMKCQPRTALERQRLESLHIQQNVIQSAARSSMMSQGIWNPVTDGRRRISLLEESSKVGQDMRRESLAKSQLYNAALIPSDSGSSTSSESDETSSVTSEAPSSRYATEAVTVTPPRQRRGAISAASPGIEEKRAQFRKKDSLAVHKARKNLK